MNILSIEKDVKYNFKFKKQFQEILDVFANILNYKTNLKVDVLITDNKGIKIISNDYRNIDKETDVLSFPFNFDKETIKTLGFNFLGEIILSFEKIQEQAKKFNHSIKREFCFLFAHGLVHLSGRDHKKSEKEEKEFNSIVNEIIEKVKIFRKN